MRSMTGFGRASAKVGSAEAAVEVKTVNHKFTDISVKVPGSFQFLEGAIRDRVRARVTRGKVDVFVKDLRPLREKRVLVNEKLAAEYLAALRRAFRKLKGKGEIPVDRVLFLPEVLIVADAEASERDLSACVIAALDKALSALSAMREAEGKRLRKDLAARLQEAAAVVRNIRVRHRASLQEKVKVFRDKVGEWVPSALQDAPRLATEEAVLLQRYDVSEELTRLDSHFAEAEAALREKGAVGRRLDFLVQEMNREANTIGSKCADPQITYSVVRLKELFEQFREQIQNVE